MTDLAIKMQQFIQHPNESSYQTVGISDEMRCKKYISKYIKIFQQKRCFIHFAGADGGSSRCRRGVCGDAR